MNQFFAILIVFGLYSVSSFANPIAPHSCRSLGELSAYCQCDFQDPIASEKILSGQVLCSLLKCSDYQLGRAPEICRGGAIALTCRLSNPAYAGQCLETFPITHGTIDELVQKCRDVVDCLNNVSCVTDNCNNTTIRFGWSLDSVTAEESRR